VLTLCYTLFGETARFHLDRDVVTLGRLEGNDVVLRDHTVSRHHARLERVGDRWQVIDLGSRNGIRVNDGQVKKSLVGPGDVITLGMVEVRLEEERAEQVSIQEGGLENWDSEGTIIRSVEEVQAMISAGAGRPREPLRVDDVDQLARITRILSALSEMARVLISAVGLREILEKVMDVIFQNVHAQRGVILLAADDTGELEPRVVRQEGGEGDTIRISQTIARKSFEDGVAILCTDAQADPRFQAGESIRFLGIRSALCVPLMLDKKVLGLIYVDSPLRVKAFEDFDLELLSALSGYGAMAIHQARLLAKLEEERRIKSQLERYHSPAVVNRILETRHPRELTQLEVREQEVSVLFSDLVGFTSRTENMPPRDVALMLNDYFSLMTEIIFDHEGTLDKFIGDAIMAVFGAPFQSRDHALKAVRCALGMRKSLAEFNRTRKGRDAPIEFRIGINTGRVVAGDIGSLKRMDYTVLGNTVNLASRLESTVARPGSIVIGEATYENVRDQISCRRLEAIMVKGISKHLNAYEVIG